MDAGPPILSLKMLPNMLHLLQHQGLPTGGVGEVLAAWTETPAQGVIRPVSRGIVFIVE